MSERVVIGIVRRTRGLHGELVVESRTDLPDRFDSLERVYLVTPAGERTVTITSVRQFKGPEVWLQFEDLVDREEAKNLRGATLEIDLDERPSPPPGSYYYDQLEGLSVVDTTGAPVGTLAHVYPRGGQDLYGVETGHGLALVPATDAIVKSVDLDSKTMVIDPPQGLLEIARAY